MKAKDYLRKIQLMDSIIDSDIEELATLEALAAKTNAVLGGERVNSTGNQQKMETAVIKIVEKQEKIRKEITDYLDYKEKLRSLVLESCDEDCIHLITKRYFGVYNADLGKTVYKSWEEIAIELGFTYRWVAGGLHAKALMQVEEALKEVLKDGDF